MEGTLKNLDKVSKICQKEMPNLLINVFTCGADRRRRRENFAILASPT